MNLLRRILTTSAVAVLIATSAPATAHADQENPGGGGTGWNWSTTRTWKENTDLTCTYKTGWRQETSASVSVKFTISCNVKAVELTSEAYLQRDDDWRNSTASVLKSCYEKKSCSKVYSIPDPAGSQTFYASSSWMFSGIADTWYSPAPRLNITFKS